MLPELCGDRGLCALLGFAVDGDIFVLCLVGAALVCMLCFRVQVADMTVSGRQLNGECVCTGPGGGAPLLLKKHSLGHDLSLIHI